MQIILEPTVTIISRPVFIEHPVYKIPSDGCDADKISAFAAKICYGSMGEEGRPNIENQKSISKGGHFSVFEHLNYGICLEGITRACSLESNRHRHLSPSQRSTRYTEESDAAIVLEPYYAKLYKKWWVKYDEDHKLWYIQASKTIENHKMEQDLLTDFLNSSERSINDYVKQVEVLMKLNPRNLKGVNLRKWARGKARNLLPHSLETRIVYTGNLRAWRHIIELRSAEGAEDEIRVVANKIYEVLKLEAPTHFEDGYIEKIVDDIPVIKFQNSSSRH